MTVSGLTMTMAARHSVQTDDNHTHKKSVGLRESKPSRPRPLQHLQLVPQGQHLQLQDGARANAASQGQQEREEDGHDGREA